MGGGVYFLLSKAVLLQRTRAVHLLALRTLKLSTFIDGEIMASRGVNKVILVGNLGQDPDTRYMPNGDAITNLNIATSETWKDKQTGNMQERTEWHRVGMYGRLAEVAGEYLKKGSKVYIEGSLRTRKWQDKSGQDRYTTEIRASEMQMLDSRGGSMDQGGYQQQNFQSQNAPQQRQPQANPGGNNNYEPVGMDDGFDDDVPF